jgi:hypothetical protein
LTCLRAGCGSSLAFNFPVILQASLSLIFPGFPGAASWCVYCGLSWSPGSSGWPCLRSIMSSGMGSVCLQSGHALQPRKSSSVARLVLTVRGCPHSGQFFAKVLGCIFPLLRPAGRSLPPVNRRSPLFLRRDALHVVALFPQLRAPVAVGVLRQDPDLFAATLAGLRPGPDVRFSHRFSPLPRRKAVVASPVEVMRDGTGPAFRRAWGRR